MKVNGPAGDKKDFKGTVPPGISRVSGGRRSTSPLSSALPYTPSYTGTTVHCWPPPPGPRRVGRELASQPRPRKRASPNRGNGGPGSCLQSDRRSIVVCWPRGFRPWPASLKSVARVERTAVRAAVGSRARAKSRGLFAPRKRDRVYPYRARGRSSRGREAGDGRRPPLFRNAPRRPCGSSTGCSTCWPTSARAPRPRTPPRFPPGKDRKSFSPEERTHRRGGVPPDARGAFFLP